MNEEFTMEPERALQTTPGVYLGEASRVAVSLNHALQLTRRDVAVCNGTPSWAG